MRLVMADVLAAQSFTNRSESPLDLSQLDLSEVNADQIIPDIYCHEVVERAGFVSDTSPVVQQCGVLIKTHEPLRAVRRWFHSNPTTNKTRHLCLFRRPQDSLVSYYHFNCRYPSNAKKTRRGVDAFCLDHLDRWIDFLADYVDVAGTDPEQVRLVNYEQMLEQAAPIVSECFQWLGHPVSRSIIDAAVDHRSFSQLQAKERGSEDATSKLFFRRGSSGAGEEELNASTLRLIQKRTDELFDRALAQSQKSIQLPTQTSCDSQAA
ncbi:Sulfotransferase domain protein [Rubripirellula amarantea]|uniref:Sulfotransferase domain protein n=2 Tax=Rubripirellula amarantea TaxID=2527999 RepID=A0A5C5WT71_9BACT|nr:Sulfotransferase domain protein [Rubripirellula amarantea]